MRRMDTTSTRASLWFGLLAGPAAWTLHELLSYALVKTACDAGIGFVLQVITVLALALAGAGAYIASRAYARPQPERDAAQFLAGAGALVSGLFVFAIFMEGIPSVVVSPCL